MKKLLSLILALAMVLLCVGAAMADETSSHTITIKNTDQNVSHSYEAYQVFKGKLDAAQQKLSDVVWGNGVNSDDLLNALKADTTYGSYFTSADSAAKVAEVLSDSPFNDTAAAIDAVSRIIASNLNSSNKVDFAADASNAKIYSANVTGDGYYFVKDTTTTLSGESGSDTLSKYLLSVVKNVEINAKDQHLTPDKEILKASGADYTRVKEDTAAIGDTVTFEVKIKVPDTTKYIDHFVFNMMDTLPAGLTFTGVTSVKVGQADVANTVTVAAAGSDTYATYDVPADPKTATGGQKIKVVFNNFKSNAEAGHWIGEDLVVTYTAVVNKNADFTPTGNKNEVSFIYSTDPNHDYDGDEPGKDDPKGETPKSTTKTKLANIIINKTDGAVVLSGAEFEIASDEYNTTLVTGEKFELSNYTLLTGETQVSDNWYKLKDGSYTQTVPSDTNRSAYESDTTTYQKISFAHFVTTPTGTTKKVTVVSGEDGVIKLEGLKPGTYTIKETKAPSGFNLDSTEHTIVISASYNATDKTITLSGTVDGNASGWDGTTATASIRIVNKSGTTLPSTGGIGTTIFYILGGLLVVGAAVVLVARRKASN